MKAFSLLNCYFIHVPDIHQERLTGAQESPKINKPMRLVEKLLPHFNRRTLPYS
jgi:hypothetical protein